MKLYRILVSFFLIAVFQLFNVSEAYVYKKLDSGQTVIVNQMKDNPIVTINTWVKTGSINEDEKNSGVAHFLEHLFFKGSKDVPPGDFDKILGSKGAITNAATSKDFTHFYITIPSKDFGLALKLHSDMLLNPLIPRKELEKERFVVLEEIARGMDSPSNLLYANLFKSIYEPSDHPYKRPVIGTKEVISTISREEILEFYNRWYTPENMITVVSGDVDADYAIKAVSESFRRDKVKTEKKTYPQIKPIDKPLKINLEKDVSQGYLAIGYRAPKFVDSKDAFALDILSAILGGSNSSVLTTEIKEKKQLVNSINASYSQYLDDGLFIISATFVPEKLAAVKQEIFDELNKVKNGNITKEQVQKAKNMIKSTTGFARESAANISDELGFFALYFNSPKMYDDYLKRIDKVSLNDVISVANKYLNQDKCAISTVLPNGFVEISNVAYAAKIPVKKDLGAKVIEENGNETKYLLDNGATLIIRKNNSNSIVAIDISAVGGAFLENRPAVEYLASKNATRGTKSFSRDELNDFLDDNGIKLSVSSHNDSFNILAMSVKDKLKDTLFVLDEVVNSPSFSKTEIDKTRKNFKEYIKAMKDRPLKLALDKFRGAAFKGYPYSNSSDVILNNIDEITRDEITAYYSKVFDAKNVIIAVTGNVDSDYLIKQFNEIFEDKGVEKVQLKNFMHGSYVPNSDSVTKIKNSDKETSWIIVGYKTVPIYDIKETATLKVIDSLLGTGMSSRLFKSLRENQALAYQVGSQIQQYGNDGALFAYIGTNFKNEETALEGILAEFNRLKTEFVPSKELSEAKEKLLGNMVIALETNMSLSELIANETLYGFSLKYLDEMKQAINEVTPSDIISFANKYFSNPSIRVIIGK